MGTIFNGDLVDKNLPCCRQDLNPRDYNPRSFTLSSCQYPRRRLAAVTGKQSGPRSMQGLYIYIK